MGGWLVSGRWWESWDPVLIGLVLGSLVMVVVPPPPGCPEIKVIGITLSK